MKKGVDYIGVGVGAVIINDEGKILLSLRGSAAQNERGKWEIPGGAVEYGETFELALKREVKEEIDVEIEVVSLLQVFDHILPEEHQHWVSPTYLCRIVNGTPKIMEKEKCEKLDWFTIDEAKKLPLSQITQKDISILERVGTSRIMKSKHSVDRVELPYA